MVINNQLVIRYIIFYIIQIILSVKGEILTNPYLLMESPNTLIINSANDEITIYSSEKKCTQDSITREILSSEDNFCSLSGINTLINQNYIYSSGSQYLISLSNDDCQSKSFTTNISISSTTQFIGNILEDEFNPNSGEQKSNLRCSCMNNEIILYGKSEDNNDIVFYFVEKNINVELDISCNIEDFSTCIKIDNSVYICAYICTNTINVGIFVYYTPETSSSCIMKSFISKTINPDEDYTHIMMIESYNDNELLICAKNTDTSNIECFFGYYYFNEYEYQENANNGNEGNEGDGNGDGNGDDNGDGNGDGGDNGDDNGDGNGDDNGDGDGDGDGNGDNNDDEGDVDNNLIVNNFNITFDYKQDIVYTLALDSSNNNDCVLKKSYNNEYLLCCGGENIIKCGRINNEYESISSLTLSLEGTTTHLDFITSSQYIHLIYMNNFNSINNIYEYSFYIPLCTNKEYSIIPLDSFSDNIINLFTKKMETNYYFKFISFPSESGNLKLNDELLEQDTLSEKEKILITDSDVFEFISTSPEVLTDLEIKYEIFIEETFSNICTIKINIQDCYDSCYLCTKSKEESDSENHNCIAGQCKEYYYQAPDIETNCFQTSDAKSNWYLDYSLYKFAYCNDACTSCDGPTDEDCLSCNGETENKYLYNKKCVTECPDGYYPESQSNQYYKCKECYPTCATCSSGGSGTNTGMNCDSCKSNSIKWSKNCYQIQDPISKTFIKPWDNQISNCFELYDFYIKEDSDTCISLPIPEGWYISNAETGVLSPCHEDCKTCEEKYTDNNSKCLLCKNEDLNFFDGNCVENCDDGYYSKPKSDTNPQKKCDKCHFTCKKCEQGQIKDSSNFLVDMNCLECKKNDNSDDIYIKVGNNCFSFIDYEEDKINFDTSLINTLPSDKIKTCFDYGLTIFYGEYECKEKPVNTYYVNTEQNTGVVKYCDEACATCTAGLDTSTGDTNCIICSNGYYKTEDSTTNCILESLIPDIYYKYTEDNIFYKCYNLCSKCVSSLNYKTSEENMGCVSCINDYYIQEGTNNCYDISFLDTHKDYYLSEEEGSFKKCYFSCEECSIGYIDEFNHNCDKCLENFYYEEGTKNCFDLSAIENGYYFDNFTINEGEEPVFKKCYLGCQTCSNYKIEDDMNCITCEDGFYKLNGTNNCIDDITNKGYYQIDGIAYPCEDNCLTCYNGKTDLTENNLDNNLEIITEISYNCLTCDEQNKNLFLIENINNCESEDFINKGYYLEEVENNQKIFKKCYKSCSLCDKYMEIDPITNEVYHNCIQCANNYYRLFNETNKINCYDDEMIEKGFILVRNFWQICHANCDECSSGPTYDSQNIINHNCISCYPGYNFVYETNNCENETFEEQGYYLDDNDNFYKKCDISCKTCEKYSTAESPKCKKCNADKYYYPAEEKPASMCYNISNIDPEYVLSERIDEDGNSYKIWSFCYETCTTCTKYGNSEEHGCTSCINNYYLIYNSTNCVTDNYAINNGYYFNKTYLKYVQCDKSCINCFGGPNKNTTNCKKCNNEEGYYSVEGKTNSLCYSNETVPEGYFLNKINQPYKWNECYENCAKCSFKGIEGRMRCLSCRTDLLNKFNKTKYFLLIEENCIEACENNLFLTKEGDCVTECPLGTYEYILNLNYSCLESCPPKYVISSDQKKCIIPEFPENATVAEFKSVIKENIVQHVNATRIIDLNEFKARIINANDFLNLMTTDSKQLYSINNFGNILEKIKEANGIHNDEDIIITQIEYGVNNGKSNENIDVNEDKINLGKSVELFLYDSLGNKLIIPDNIDAQFELKIFIGNLAYLNLEESKTYNEKGIDIFNESEPFFNDICYPFKTEFDSDVILKDRRKYIFKNVDFCGTNCNYNKINYDLMNVNCLCDLNKINNDNIEGGILLNSRKIEFTEDLYSTNLVLIKCGNLVFDSTIIKSNIGFIFNMILLSTEIIFFGLFYMNGLKSIKNLILIFEPKIKPSPPKLKEILALAENKKEKNKDEEIKKSILINHLITAKKRRRSDDGKNVDDALVIDYNDDKKNKNKKFKEKENKKEETLEDYSEDDKEKKTGLKKPEKKSHKKRRIIFTDDINKENMANIKEILKKQGHPLDYIIANEPLMDNYLLNKHMKLGNIHTSNYLYMNNQNSENMEIKSNEEKNNKNNNKKEKKKNIQKIKKDEKSNYLLNKYQFLFMEYEEAIKKDKRKFSEIFISYLIENNFILNTILSDSFINIISIKISYLCFRLILIFVLNAMFYSDNYITDVYENKGTLNFFYSLPKAIYSLLITLFISALLKLLINNHKKILELITYKDKAEFHSILNISLIKIKYKLIAYFCIEFSLSLFCLYYCSAFCAVYQNSKIFWFCGCLETILFDFIFSLIICLIITTFRFEGIEKRIKCFYKFSKVYNYI